MPTNDDEGGQGLKVFLRHLNLLVPQVAHCAVWLRLLRDHLDDKLGSLKAHVGKDGSTDPL